MNLVLTFLTVNKIKSPWLARAVDIPIFARIFVCMFVSHPLTKRKAIYNWNLVHRLRNSTSKNLFFEKLTPDSITASSRRFQQISPIALFHLFFINLIFVRNFFLSTWSMYSKTCILCLLSRNKNTQQKWCIFKNFHF